MTVALWRISAETPDYTASDLSGRGAEISGGRWNPKGMPIIYTATSIALAVLETVVHLPSAPLPLNRYLVRIEVPDEAWAARVSIDANSAPVGWDAEPAGLTSRAYGEAWLRGSASLLCAVPSIIVPCEQNILLNPRHPQAGQLRVQAVEKFYFDGRLRLSS